MLYHGLRAVKSSGVLCRRVMPQAVEVVIGFDFKFYYGSKDVGSMLCLRRSVGFLNEKMVFDMIEKCYGKCPLAWPLIELAQKSICQPF
jgi:hypothetical protein